MRFYDLDRDFDNHGWGWVSGCCWVYFKFLGFFISCGFDYFSGFMGLICWRFRWMIEILNEFLHVYLLRKCNKRKEKKKLIILIFWAIFMFFPEEHEEHVTLFFRK